jgi:protein involved in polysaccharide export with SLBB domain
MDVGAMGMMRWPADAVKKWWSIRLFAAGGLALVLLVTGMEFYGQVQAESLMAEASQTEYVLDVGDEIRIDDALIGNLASLDPSNQAGSSDSVQINEDGLVDLPLVGQLQLSGLPISEAQKRLNQKFSRVLQNPNISIQILTQHPVRIYVQGEVNRPGVYISGKSTQPDNKEHASLGGSNATEIFSRYYLTDALIQAGGLKVSANYQDIRIYRGAANPQVLHVNLWQLVQQGNSAGDIPLEEHDRVEVPPLPPGQLAFSEDWKSINRTNIGVQLFQINVIGAVKQPGSYPISTRENIVSAIALAGGLTPTANPTGVYLLRTNEHGQVFKKRLVVSERQLIAKRRENWPTLLPGDVIFVDDSVGKQALTISKTLVDRTAGAALLPFFSSLAAGSGK